MQVNNELGTINPISEIGKTCFDKGVLFHSDAAQSFVKIETEVDDLNVDVMSFSAHKIGGPKGIGAIYIRDLRKKQLLPVIHGAGQEEGQRGGTVAAPLIIGFGKAIEVFPTLYHQFKSLKIKFYLLEQLKLQGIEHNVNGFGAALESFLSLTLPDTDTLVRENKYKLCLAQGSACSSKEIEPSHVLTALGLNRKLADHTFRVSFPLDISISDIDVIVSEIQKHTKKADKT